MLFQSFINKHRSFFILQCSISECKSKSIKTVKISFRETRNLCKNHLELFSNKDKEHFPIFTKASKI